MAGVQGLLGPDPKIANDILEGLWAGRVSYTKGKGREAAGSAFTECLCFLLTQVLLCPVSWMLMLPAVMHFVILCCRKKCKVCAIMQHEPLVPRGSQKVLRFSLWHCTTLLACQPLCIHNTRLASQCRAYKSTSSQSVLHYNHMLACMLVML